MSSIACAGNIDKKMDNDPMSVAIAPFESWKHLMEFTNPLNPLIILTGTSCAGKSKCIKAIQRELGELGEGIEFQSVVSCTTRTCREKENNKVDYFFVQEEKFNEAAKHGVFFEHSTIYKNYYGKPLANLARALLNQFGKPVICDLHPTTVKHYKELKELVVRVVSIFIVPKDMGLLEVRMIKHRAERGSEVYKCRMAGAEEEISMLKADGGELFDHTVESEGMTANDLKPMEEKVVRIVRQFI